MVAAADPNEDNRRRFAAEFGAKVYESDHAMCGDSGIDAVYIATPHQWHATNTRVAAAAGKHVLVEKPMALSVADCITMIEACRAAKVALVVGHSHSFDAPIRRAHEIIASGSVGAVKMLHAFDYTDFLYRPRRPEELDPEAGGGAIFNQGSHQVDVARLLCGGKASAVRAVTGAWDRARPVEAAYSALVTFDSGAVASLTYSGFAHFDSDELMGWIGEGGAVKDGARYGAARRALRGEDEATLRRVRGYGAVAGTAAAPAPAPHHPHFGPLIVSCERADLRPLPDCIWIYGNDEKHQEKLPPPTQPRQEVLDAFYEAAVHGRAPAQTGEWGLATLEVCLAIAQSAREGRDIVLHHQTALL